MGNKKNEMFVLMLILAVAIAGSCTITTTTNKYYGYPDPNAKPDTKKEIRNQSEADTLKTIENERNE